MFFILILDMIFPPGQKKLPNDRFTCLACGDSKVFTRTSTIRHEKTQKHLDALNNFRRVSFLQSAAEETLPVLHDVLDDMSQGFLLPDYGLGNDSDSSLIDNLNLDTFDPIAQQGAAILAKALKSFLMDAEYSEDEGDDEDIEPEREESDGEEEQRDSGLFLLKFSCMLIYFF